MEKEPLSSKSNIRNTHTHTHTQTDLYKNDGKHWKENGEKKKSQITNTTKKKKTIGFYLEGIFFLSSVSSLSMISRLSSVSL